MSDVRASATYRLAMAQQLTIRALQEAAGHRSEALDALAPIYDATLNES